MNDRRLLALTGLAVSKENNLTPSLRIDLDYCVDECHPGGQPSGPPDPKRRITAVAPVCSP